MDGIVHLLTTSQPDQLRACKESFFFLAFSEVKVGIDAQVSVDSGTPKAA